MQSICIGFAPFLRINKRMRRLLLTTIAALQIPIGTASADDASDKEAVVGVVAHHAGPALTRPVETALPAGAERGRAGRTIH